MGRAYLGNDKYVYIWFQKILRIFQTERSKIFVRKSSLIIPANIGFLSPNPNSIWYPCSHSTHITLLELFCTSKVWDQPLNERYVLFSSVILWVPKDGTLKFNFKDNDQRVYYTIYHCSSPREDTQTSVGWLVNEYQNLGMLRIHI